jgi:hypothetical protein
MKETKQEIGAIDSTGKNQHYESQQSSYHQGDHRSLCGTSHRHRRRRGSLYWISLSVRVILASPRRHYLLQQKNSSAKRMQQVVPTVDGLCMHSTTTTIAAAPQQWVSGSPYRNNNNKRRVLSETIRQKATINSCKPTPTSSGDYRQRPTQSGWQEWNPHDKLGQRWPVTTFTCNRNSTRSNN